VLHHACFHNPEDLDLKIGEVLFELFRCGVTEKYNCSSKLSFGYVWMLDRCRSSIIFVLNQEFHLKFCAGTLHNHSL
jgi:hypothetical protein